MLIIILLCLIGNIVLVFKLTNIKAEKMGEISSYKLELKEKIKEIDNLQRKIIELKCINNDVEV